MNPPVASVVIPAHNEQSVIGECLSAVAAARCAAGLSVVVVANGCRDDTAARARGATGLPGLQVVDLDVASKVAALNEGDRVAGEVFPRIYLDADIRLGDGALDALVEALRGPEPRLATPRVRFDLDGAVATVRSFYRVFRELPYIRQGRSGGVYALSAAGRARFAEFPQLTADDLFVHRLFADDERVIVDADFLVRVPRDLRSLVAVRTRVARGNRELADSHDDPAFARTTGGTGAALAGYARRGPGPAADALIYTAITLAGRLRARSGPIRWDRDHTSR